LRFRIEYIDLAEDEEIILRCHSLDENIRRHCQAIEAMLDERPAIVYTKGEQEFYLISRDILYFETQGETVYAHTAKDLFKVNYRLYQLESMLPPEFLRISKSTIANTARILSLTKSVSSNTIQFAGSNKEVHVSRFYFKELKQKLSQRRG